MVHGQPVQHFSVKLPLRHELLHQSDETSIVSGFEKMRHLMHHNVFEAFQRFLRKFGVEPDAAGDRIATAPLGLHPAHEMPRNTRFAAVVVNRQGSQASRGALDTAATQPPDALHPEWVALAPSNSVTPLSLMSSVALPLL